MSRKYIIFRGEFKLGELSSKTKKRCFFCKKKAEVKFKHDKRKEIKYYCVSCIDELGDLFIDYIENYYTGSGGGAWMR